VKSKRLHPAWIAAGITFLTLMGAAGMRSAPSVLMVPLEDEFGWSRSIISLAVGINVLLFGLTAPFAAALMEKFGVRRVVMSALTSVGLGSGLTIFMKSSWQLILLWGVLVGVGAGSMALVFVATVVNRWFISKRGLVSGVLSAATASGQLIFLPSVASIASHHGWRAASLLVSGGALMMVPLIYFFMKESPQAVGSTPLGADVDWQAPVKNDTNPAKLAISILRRVSRSKAFILLTFSFFVCGLSTSGLIGTHFIPAAHDHGMSDTTAAGLLAMVGVFDVIGTLASGWLTDRVPAKTLLFFYYGLRGISLVFLPAVLFSSVHPSTLIFVLFYGLDWVATVPPTFWLCREIFGVQYGAIVYGWVYAAHQIGGAVAAFLAGVMRVHFGDYALAFYITGAICMLTATLVLKINVKERPLEV
jgi:sugar phosphate permease